MTYPSTNTLECMYVDHPVVAILENYNPSEIVEPYYKFFLDKGVFHYTMYSLTKHLNEMNVDTWWSDIVNHETYKNFKKEFIRSV